MQCYTHVLGILLGVTGKLSSAKLPGQYSLPWQIYQEPAFSLTDSENRSYYIPNTDLIYIPRVKPPLGADSLSPSPWNQCANLLIYVRNNLERSCRSWSFQRAFLLAFSSCRYNCVSCFPVINVAWYLFFRLFTFNLSILLYLRRAPCR